MTSYNEQALGGHRGWERSPSGDVVSVGPFQRRFAELGISQGELARRMGWERMVPDRTRVRHALGLSTAHPGHGPRARLAQINRRTAEQLAAALGLDPWECGL
jgi:hypothetical protein